MKVEVSTIIIVRTPQDILKHKLNNARVEWAKVPIFEGGGYFYVIEGDVMFTISEDLIDKNDFRIFIFVEK